MEIAGYKMAELMLIVFALHASCAMLLLSALVENRLKTGRMPVRTALIVWAIAFILTFTPIRAGTIMFINGAVVVLVLQSIFRVVMVFRGGEANGNE